MKITFSAIKADVGSIGGHTRPSEEMLDYARKAFEQEEVRKEILDAYLAFTGDDMSLLMVHQHGLGAEKIHRFAWEVFKGATEIAKSQGLYGAGQDLLKDAFSGNVRGLGPGVAEMEFEERPNEALVVFAADKTEPGAFNLPLYFAFADPMHSPGLLLKPEVGLGFTFNIMDVAHLEGDKIITLNAPEDLHDIAALLRDTHRYVIESIWSRYDPKEPAAVVSTTRLHNIAGKYVGKDDPIAIVRVQSIFAATEEVVGAFANIHYVAGDTRGSHNMPLMPVPMNSSASGYFCLPMIAGMAFSLHQGKLTKPFDTFADPFWDTIRDEASKKAIEMRRQGFFQPATLPFSELEYGGITDRLKQLEPKFKINGNARTQEESQEEKKTPSSIIQLPRW